MEGEAQVRLVFAGEILQGFQIDEVKRRFGEAFKLDEARIAAMFSGTRTVLKRSLSQADAERHLIQLGKLGARVHIEPLEAAPAATPPAIAAAPPAVALLPPLAPLEEQVTCPNCGERQPKRAFCRSCTTDIERALAAKKEDADRARAERLDATGAGGRWAAPRSAAGEVGSSGALVDPPPMLSLSFEGRMGRISYINAGAVAWAAVAVIGILAAVLFPLTRSVLMLIPLGLAFLVFFAWSLRVMALRLHDFNRSGWWVLLFFVPYLGALASLVLVFMPGSAEDNDYGEKPRQGNGLIATIVVVVGLVGLIALATIGTRSYSKYAKRSAQAQTRGQEDPATTQRAAEYLRSPAANEAFTEYAREPNNKAFAVSGEAWGWRAGQASARDAATKALEACDQKRVAYTSPCRVVNFNGAWVPQR